MQENIEKAHVYKELYRTQLEKFDRTRHIEWWVNISFWTLIVLMVNVVNCLPSFRFKLLICVTMGALHFLWMLFIQCSENEDLKRAYVFRKKALECLGVTDLPGKDSGLKTFFWIIAPVIVTVVLLWGILFHVKMPCK